MALPTEAQYEYAARAGETGMYPGGSLDEVAWHDGNSGGYLKPVGTKKANAWGLHDMNGSVWEWVQDSYYVELPGGTDPIAKETGPDRVIRGGCWFKEATRCRLATRSYRWQGASECFSIGFRIVRNGWPVEVSKPAIDPEIKGQNVTKVSYQGSTSEQSFEQTGPKSWKSGEAVYNEVKRNEWNVHLQRVAEFDERVQIDLSQMSMGNGDAQTMSPGDSDLASKKFVSSVGSFANQTFDIAKRQGHQCRQCQNESHLRPSRQDDHTVFEPRDCCGGNSRSLHQGQLDGTVPPPVGSRP